MRTRMLLSASAIALVAASCSQPEPHVLSDAPRSTSATNLTTVDEPTESEPEAGRFIARCATEADGGTPGMTVFTDGTQSVTDHCLSRYYIGVQPAPGALYVPDEDTGTYAPSRSPENQTTSTTQQWTPAQPRTDAGVNDDLFDREDSLDGTDDPTETEEGDENTDSTTPDSEVTPTESTPVTTTPGTEPGETTTPGTEPTDPGETDPTTPGSSESPTTDVPVPTVTETPIQQQTSPQTPVTSTAPSGPLGSTGSHGSTGSGISEGVQGSTGSHGLPYPFGGPRRPAPTAVQAP